MKRHRQDRSASIVQLSSRQDVRGRDRETHYRQEARVKSNRFTQLENLESDSKAKGVQLSDPDKRELAEYRRETPFTISARQAELARREPELKPNEKDELEAWRKYGDKSIVDLEVKVLNKSAKSPDLAELEALKRTGNRRHGSLARLKAQFDQEEGKGPTKMSKEELIELKGLDDCDGDSICAGLYKAKYIDNKSLKGCDLKELQFVEKRAVERAQINGGHKNELPDGNLPPLNGNTR